jgi:hypothetical protein
VTALPSIFLARPQARKPMRDFFSAHIRNANTRPVHLKAIRQFSVLVLGLGLWTACTTDAITVRPRKRFGS